MSTNGNLENIAPWLSVDDYLLNVREILSRWVDAADFDAKVRLVFGSGVDTTEARAVIRDFASSGSALLPKIEVRSGSEINGARGAFAGANNTIYLSREFLLGNGDNADAVTAVLLEEIGHAIDWRLNGVDTPGDEGELFSDLVRGVGVSEGELRRIRAEDDSAIVTIDGQTLEIEQAGTTFVNLANPVGITIDTQGNFVVNSDNSVNFIISKISPDRTLLQQTQYGSTLGADLGHLSTITNRGKILQLQKDGDLIIIDPSNLFLVQYANLKYLSVDTSSIFDIATGETGNLGGLISPGAANTQYGDISILERGDQQDIFVSGLSMGTFPFIMRLRFQSGSLQNTKVIVASRGSTAGNVNLTRGVAVNNQGVVLTTLPIGVGRNLPQFIDVPVSFSADFPEGQGESPQVRFEGQGANYSDGSNHLDIASQGITTDAAGNFYVVTNSLGSTALSSSGGGTLVVLSPNVSRVLDVQSGQVLVSYRDVAVNSNGSLAFVTSSEGRVLSFPISISTTNFEIATTNTSIQTEGNNGTKPFTFTVTRSENLNRIDTVNWIVTGTVSNSVKATDFGGSFPSGILTFNSEESSKTITVNVSGDTTIEPDETFAVKLFNPSNGATIPTATAIGTIQNDDTPGDNTVPILPTSNDNFANRILLTGNNLSVTGTNVGFTGETGEPVRTGGRNSAWWSWTAPQSSVVTINTNGSDFDTFLSVFTGNAINSLVLVSDDSDSGTGNASQVQFNAVAGTTYQIAVNGDGSRFGNITGDINLAVNFTPVVGDGAIRGVKWNDLDGDGTKDAGEPGLQGWKIYLDVNKNGRFDTGEISTITDTSGNYAFTNLTPATYTVAEVLQAGWQQTSPNISNQNSFRLLSTQLGENQNVNLIELQRNPFAQISIGSTAISVGFDVDPTTNLLYGASQSLYRINPTNGSSTTIGAITNLPLVGSPPLTLITSIAFAPDGTLYGVSILNQRLYTIDLSNGFATEIGTTTASGIDFAPDGTLYGVSLDSNLVKLNPTTGGVLATIGATGITGFDIDFAPDGFIYGSKLTEKELYRIDPSNASTTLIGTLDSSPLGVASVSSVLGIPGTHSVALNAGQNVTGINFGNRQINLPSITLTVNPTTVTEDGTTNLVYTFTRTGSTASPLSANYTVGGTAAFTSDYSQTGAASFNATTGSITFAAGSDKAILTIDPTANTIPEVNETVALTLATGTGYAIGTPNPVTGTITDDDKTRPTTGNDSLTGTSGNETIDGLAGNDIINGGAGNDTLIGGAGNDTLTGGVGNDNLVGGLGTDRVVESGNVNFVLTKDRLTGNGTDTLSGIEQANLTGGAGKNTLDASAFILGAVTLNGGAGNDALMGGSKNDRLTGGTGNDTLIGGVGNDSLTGGLGSDRFTFNNRTEGIDQITDFLSSQGDKIAISASRFGGGLVAGAALKSAQFTQGSAVTSASTRFIYNQGNLFFDRDGTGALPANQIATLSTQPAFAFTDIVVIA